ncbi:MAG: ion channel [Pseudomonadota bacterium]|jgi:inward rectifier potassium channel|nr:ion channel [Pseudomonadota bacterium]
MSDQSAPSSPTSLSRMIKSESQLQVRPLGGPRLRTPDVYHQLLRASWLRLTLYFLATFFLFNCLFAGLFMLDQHGFTHPDPRIAAPRFWEFFFFSIETVATVGYGNMVPLSLYANIVVAIEISLGILFFALVTGIMFARFSRPTARILFSKVAVIGPIEGVPTLMFRAANQRHNLIFEAAASVSLLGDEMVEGVRMRRFRDLKLVREANPIFTLTWTIMHPIDEDSPLHQWLDSREPPEGFEIIIVLSGVDERTGQAIHGRWGYTPRDLRWNARFVDILGKDAKGIRTVDYGRFDEVRELAQGAAQVEARA